MYGWLKQPPPLWRKVARSRLHGLLQRRLLQRRGAMLLVPRTVSSPAHGPHAGGYKGAAGGLLHLNRRMMELLGQTERVEAAAATLRGWPAGGGGRVYATTAAHVGLTRSGKVDPAMHAMCDNLSLSRLRLDHKHIL
jgi:hypothetical protein